MVALAAVGAPGAPRAAAGPEGARLLESSPFGMRFEAAFPAAQITPIGAEGASPGVRVDMDGCATTDAPGEPALPSRTLTVAVPPTGAVRVSGVTLGGAVRDGVDVPRTPWLDDGSGRAAPAPAPYTSARLIDVSWMRQQRVARIEVRPARYDAAARRLTTYDRVDVTVDVDAAPAATTPPDSDAFEPIYRRLLVNYEQGRAWRSVRGAAGAARVTTGGPGKTLAQTREALTVPDNSVYVGRRWVKIAIRETGFYRLSYSQFKSYAPFNNDTTIASDSLRLITWSGFPVLPEASYCDSCDYHEVALGIIDDDGRMNRNNDAIYFYAVGPSDWADRFDSTLPDTVFLNHQYERRNFYYLGLSTAAQPFSGMRRRIATRNAAPSGGAVSTPASFPWRVHQEQDNQYDANQYPMGSTYAWEKFFWSLVPEGSTFSAPLTVVGADSTQPARVRARVWSQFVECNSCLVCSDQRQFVTMYWNGAPSVAGWFGYTGYTIDKSVSIRRSNTLQITMSDLRCNNEIMVHWFDVFYQRKFEPTGDKLEFRSPAGGGTSLYRVGPFAKPSQPRLFDVSDPLAPVEITGATYAGVTGGYQLSFESTDTDRSRYDTFQETDFGVLSGTDVSGASGSSVDDLRSPNQEADYVLIYFDDYRQAADSLTGWRQAYNGFRTKSVPISAIYDQFSGGRTDPTAIRNFLRAAFQNWRTPQPAYVTFLGDASYDFKDILLHALPGQPGSPLPTYENSFEALLTRRQYTTDDWLLNVDDPSSILPDFLGGRLPVTSASIALDVVRNKVLGYERSGRFGTHRDRVMLIADDSEQGSTADPLQWTHLQQTHTLDSLFTPNSFDRDYIYLHTFPTTTSYTKPICRDSIKAGIGVEGVAVANYIGHGSPFQLADEIVLVATDADGLRNDDRLPLFVAASCDVGRFSDPINSSLGEHLVNNPEGGAIGVISSTDLAFAGLNAQLNRTIFRTLFARPVGGGEMSGEVAKALVVAKVEAAQTSTGGVNAQKYTLLGDAALDLDLPRYWVDIHVKDDQGIDTTAIQQGRRMTFTGQVLTAPNGTPVPLDGTADLLVEDAQPLLTAPPCAKYTCAQPNYLYKAGPVYRGSAAVQGGQLSGQFMVPLEAAPGKRGRIRVYLSGQGAGTAGTDAVGDLPVRVAAGTVPVGDVSGPVIRLTFPNGVTRVAPDAILRIDLADSSGILLTGHTPQNGIVVTVDDNTTTREEVTNSFRYNPGSFQSGTAQFQLPQPPDRSPLREGLHVISVSAADNLAAGLSAGQHRSHATLQFEVVNQPPLKVLDAYLFPNPASSTSGASGGRFVVDTEGGRVDLQLRLYTVSGRMIRRLEMSGIDGQVQVPWDGLDAEGQGLANGTYLFKVVVRSADSSDSGDKALTADLSGKFVIINP